jgi:anti-sigma regulatory factor (Ser/Thr protein kinase)
MPSQFAELRLPADRNHILVAKRTTSAMAALAGLPTEAIDDLTIAVTQACENAISCLESSCVQQGRLHLTFQFDPSGLEVRLHSHTSPAANLAARLQRAEKNPPPPLGFSPALGLRLMSLFVDDSSYRLSPRTGNLHVRLIKFRTI